MTHGDLGLVGAVCGFSLEGTRLPSFAFGSFFFFSLFFFSFFSLGGWLLPALPCEDEGSEEVSQEVEGWWVVLDCSDSWFDCSGLVAIWTTLVEKSHTGRPIVNPGSDNVAIWGAPTSPQEEKGLGLPPRGSPWLVDSILLNLRPTQEWWYYSD